MSYYVMPYGDDSYYYDGYQTVFLLDKNNNTYGPVTESKIVPFFTLGNKVIAGMLTGYNRIAAVLVTTVIPTGIGIFCRIFKQVLLDIILTSTTCMRR